MASLKTSFMGLLVLLGLSSSVANRVILDSTTADHEKLMKDGKGEIGLKWNRDEGGHQGEVPGYGIGIGIGKGNDDGSGFGFGYGHGDDNGGGGGYGIGIGKGKGDGYGIGIGGRGKPCHGGGRIIYVPGIRIPSCGGGGCSHGDVPGDGHGGVSCSSCPPECLAKWGTGQSHN